MIYTYADCIKKFGSDYLIKKEIKEGRLFKKEKGIYSDEKICSDMDIILAKYPRAIFTGESAFYYYGLTDVIPSRFFLATKRTDSRIKDKKVKQVFVNDVAHETGKTSIEYQGRTICIYSKERLLVDLVRQKKRVPYDYYKEIILNYRRIAEKLDYFHMEDCAREWKNADHIMETIEAEVL